MHSFIEHAGVSLSVSRPSSVQCLRSHAREPSHGQVREPYPRRRTRFACEFVSTASLALSQPSSACGRRCMRARRVPDLRASGMKRDGEDKSSRKETSSSVTKRRRPWWRIGEPRDSTEFSDESTEYKHNASSGIERSTGRASFVDTQEEHSKKSADEMTDEEDKRGSADYGWPWRARDKSNVQKVEEKEFESNEGTSADKAKNGAFPNISFDLFGSHQKLKHEQQKLSGKVDASDRPDQSDPWGKILDLIIPNRNSNSRNSNKSAAISNDSVESRQDASMSNGALSGEQNSEEARNCEHGVSDEETISNGASSLDTLRGVRELYQPPMSDLLEKKEDSTADKGNAPISVKKQTNSSVVSKLLPWLERSQNSKSAKSTECNSSKPKARLSNSSTSRTSPKRQGGSSGETSVPSASTEVKVAEDKKVDSELNEVRGKSAEGFQKLSKKSPVSVKPAGEETSRNESALAKGKSSSKVVSTTANSAEFSSIPQKDIAAIRLIFGSETFFATETLSPPGGLLFRGNLRGEPKATLAKLEQRLATRLGNKYTLCLAEGEEDLRPVVVVVPTARDLRPATPREKVFAVAIAFVTLSTCFARGAYANLNANVIRSAYGFPRNASLLDSLFQYAPISTMGVSIAVVVLFSQIVQRIVAARRKTRVALPYLIPSYQLGSFGALVQLASPTPSRAALFDIASSGAATLFVISLGLLIQGLRLSTTFASVIPVSMSMVSSSMLIGALTTCIPQGQILVDYTKSWIGLHPLAVIGANCLTIAALNLLPIRQLDGGRIVVAIYGRKTAVLASRITIFFLLIASAKMPYYFVFLAAVTFGPWNVDRPAKNELTEPDGIRAVVGYILLLLMVAVLLPYPASKFFGTA